MAALKRKVSDRAGKGGKGWEGMRGLGLELLGVQGGWGLEAGGEIDI